MSIQNIFDTKILDVESCKILEIIELLVDQIIFYYDK